MIPKFYAAVGSQDYSPAGTALAFACIAFLAFAGCKDTSTNPPVTTNPGISGTVIDTNGTPVAGAFLNFEFEYAHPVGGVVVDTPSVSRDSEQTTVQFQLSQNGLVTCKLINFVGTTVRTFFNGNLPAGTQSVTCTPYDDQGRLLYSDAYFVELDFNYQFVGSSPILFGTLPQQFSTNPLVYMQTDSKGKFHIPAGRFPLGQQFLVRTTSSSEVDTVSFANNQLLSAFDSTQYGFASVSVANGATVQIVLNRKRF